MKDEQLPAKGRFESKQFKVFCSELEEQYDDIELKFLFLKAGLNLPLSKIAKTLGRRYEEVIKLNKKLEEVISNIRLDCRLHILHSEKVQPDMLFRAKAKEAKAILEELDRRAEKEKRFDGVSDKHLHEMLAKISEDLRISGDYYTGDIEMGEFPSQKTKGNFE
jgi:hypothetical protein